MSLALIIHYLSHTGRSLCGYGNGMPYTRFDSSIEHVNCQQCLEAYRNLEAYQKKQKPAAKQFQPATEKEKEVAFFFGRKP